MANFRQRHHLFFGMDNIKNNQNPLETKKNVPVSIERIGALVLAAGEGRRMGHRPKCLLRLNGLSLLELQLQALSQAGIRVMSVVLGHHAARIQQEEILNRWSAQAVINPQPETGHIGSLRIGLQALPLKLDAVIVALADQALIQTYEVSNLIQAFEQRPNGTELLQPSVNGLPGNPVIFSTKVKLQILAGDAHMGARQWQLTHPSGIYSWSTQNENYRFDIDTEEDRLRFEHITGQSLVWPNDLDPDANAVKYHP